MARPVAADPQATRARILSSARARFTAQGMEGASVREIAADAGVSLATVLHHFGSKEALQKACIDDLYRELAGLRAALLERVTPGAALSTLLDEAVRAAFRFARQHRAAVMLMLQTTLSMGGLPVDKRDGYMAPLLDLAEGLFAVEGRTPQQARLGAQSMANLITRYALHSDDELQLISGEKKRATAEAAIEEHLVAVAVSLLGPAGAVVTRHQSPEAA